MLKAGGRDSGLSEKKQASLCILKREGRKKRSGRSATSRNLSLQSRMHPFFSILTGPTRASLAIASLRKRKEQSLKHNTKDVGFLTVAHRLLPKAGLYWITRSARASTLGEIVRPIRFAVFRLITNSIYPEGTANGGTKKKDMKRGTGTS